MPLRPARELLDAMRGGPRLVGDGAVGTELMRRGVPADRILAANRERPELVRAVHGAYLSAGADALTANTFGTPCGDLALALREGVGLAVRAAQACPRPVGVFVSLPPALALSEIDAVRFAARQSLVWPGAVLFETCTAIEEAAEAARRVREALRPEFLAVTCHFGRGGTIPDGTTPGDAARALTEAGADAVGANCGDTETDWLRLARAFRAATDLPLLFAPNAGLPVAAESGPPDYPLCPEAFAALGAELWREGATLVGGCCGTTPAHVAALVARQFRPISPPV